MDEKQLLHFRLVEKLGAGGMGVVYKAWNEKLRKHCALKVLAPQYTSDPERRERFLREARAAAAVNHPNVAVIYDIYEGGDSEGTVFIAMEYVEGETLRSQLGKGALPQEVTRRLAVQVAKGLSQAHRMGVIHRDLKPENIMVDAHGNAKILDFGLAKRVEGEKQAGGERPTAAVTATVDITKKGEVWGTPAYMSPEQIRGETVDFRTDIFSFGALLYEMLTGTSPFRRATDAETRAAVLHHEPSPASPSGRFVPPQLNKILDRCLSKDSRSRWNDAETVARELEGAVWQKPRRWIAAPSSFIRRRRWALAIPIVAVAALAYVLWPRQTIRPSSNVLAIMPFTFRGDTNLEYLGEGMVDLLSWRLTGVGEIRASDTKVLFDLLSRQDSGLAEVERARAVAREMQAGRVLLGSVVAAEGRLEVTAILYETESNEPGTAVDAVQGNEEDVLQVVDRLAAEILFTLGGSRAAGAARAAWESTESLAALKHYLTAQSYYRRERYEDAVESYRRAITEDSLFAMAHYGLCRAAGYSLRFVGMVPSSLDTVLRLLNRLPLSEQRKVRALEAQRRKDINTAITILEEQVRQFPDDLDAYDMLGIWYCHRGRRIGRGIADAKAICQRMFAYDSTNSDATANMQWISVMEGNREATLRWTRKRLEQDPSSSYAALCQGILAFAGDDADAQREAVRLLSGENGFTVWSTANMLAGGTGELAKAQALLDSCLKSPGDPGRETSIRLTRAHLGMAQGLWGQAQDDLLQLAEEDPSEALLQKGLLALHPLITLERREVSSLLAEVEGMSLAEDSTRAATYRAYLTGMLRARLQDFVIANQEAENLAQIAAECQAADPMESVLARELAIGVQAECARVRGQEDRALAELERGHPEDLFGAGFLNPSNHANAVSRERYMRATLLGLARRDEEALRWYRSLGSDLIETSYLAPKHLRMAEIYDRRGEREKAIWHYSQFIDMWRHCDPEFQPVLEEAKQELVRLQG